MYTWICMYHTTYKQKEANRISYVHIYVYTHMNTFKQYIHIQIYTYIYIYASHNSQTGGGQLNKTTSSDMWFHLLHREPPPPQYRTLSSPHPVLPMRRKTEQICMFRVVPSRNWKTWNPEPRTWPGFETLFCSKPHPQYSTTQTQNDTHTQNDEHTRRMIQYEGANTHTQTQTHSHSRTQIYISI